MKIIIANTYQVLMGQCPTLNKMSRSNPYKKKVRTAKKTLLAYGEGETEKAFLRFLVSEYNYATGVHVDVDYAGGKSPNYIIKKACDKRQIGRHNQAFILLDSDKPCSSTDIALAKKIDIELIFSEPCIEGLFLNILEPSLVVINWTSKKCKKYFEQKFLKEKEKLNYINYKKIITKESMEKARKINSNINRIVSLIENKG